MWEEVLVKNLQDIHLLLLKMEVHLKVEAEVEAKVMGKTLGRLPLPTHLNR
jgi:hypothetical protein